MARSTTVITSIVEGGKTSPENVTIDSISWSTDNGTITLSATVPATVNIGDVITDSAGNDYLITGISGADLTCQDFSTTTDPATGAATIDAAYSSGTNWEADLDAGTNAEVYKSGDAAIGHGYNTGGAFDETLTISGGGGVGLASVQLTVPSGERHDGQAASAGGSAGTRIVFTGGTGQDHLVVVNDNKGIDYTFDWWEIDANAQDVRAIVECNPDGGEGNCRWLIAHNNHSDSNTAATYGFSLQGSGGPIVDVLNCMIYAVEQVKGTGSGNTWGIRSGSGNGKTSNTINCTIHKTVDAGGNAEGYDNQDTGGSHLVRNTIATDSDTADFGTIDNGDYCVSSDATAPGANSVTNVTTADQYVSTTAGMEDLHLKSGSDAINAGEDRGTTPAGVDTDIDGETHGADGTWDVGSDEAAAAPTTTNTLPLLGVG